MGDQCRLAKNWSTTTGFHLERGARQFDEPGQGLGGQGQRNQCWAGRNHGKTELFCKPVAEGRGADFRD